MLSVELEGMSASCVWIYFTTGAAKIYMHTYMISQPKPVTITI